MSSDLLACLARRGPFDFRLNGPDAHHAKSTPLSVYLDHSIRKSNGLRPRDTLRDLLDRQQIQTYKE